MIERCIQIYKIGSKERLHVNLSQQTIFVFFFLGMMYHLNCLISINYNYNDRRLYTNKNQVENQ